MNAPEGRVVQRAVIAVPSELGVAAAHRERWSFGTVTILGDAAHPMSQAVLDQAAIAEPLTPNPNPEAVLRAYENAPGTLKGRKSSQE